MSLGWPRGVALVRIRSGGWTVTRFEGVVLVGRNSRRYLAVGAACATGLALTVLGGEVGLASTPTATSWHPAGGMHGTLNVKGFGGAVALSADGHLALVGTDGTRYRGASVYSDASGQWRRVAILAADDGQDGDGFGRSVALTPDGSTALVGAPHAHGHGEAYVFSDVGGDWQQTAELAGSSVSAGDAFGTSVAITADATQAVIGSQPNPDGTSVPRGAAYVFRFAAGSWAQAQQLDPPIRGRNAFGFAVAVSADGTVLMVGAPGDITSRRPYVATYQLDGDGQWVFGAQLTCPCFDNRPEFGAALALSADGHVALVGAPDTGGGCSSGWVMAYRDASLIAKFVPGECGVAYGTSVGLSADGTVALVGGPEPIASFPATGQARVIEGIGSGHARTTKIAPSGLADGDQYGGAVALSADGDTALVGAPLRTGGPGARYHGIAFVFRGVDG